MCTITEWDLGKLRTPLISSSFQMMKQMREPVKFPLNKVSIFASYHQSFALISFARAILIQ